MNQQMFARFPLFLGSITSSNDSRRSDSTWRGSLHLL